jgi:hypothetical protein
MTKYQPNMAVHWKLRAIDATRGNKSMLGAILLAMLNHVPNKRPYFKGLGHINKEGFVSCKFYPRGLLLPRKVVIGTVQSWTDELRRLADMVHMDDKEVHELFEEARKWIERDERAVSRLS